MDIDLYCKIYVECRWSQAELVDKISSQMNGSVFIRSIATERLSIAVFENPTSGGKGPVQASDFLGYPFYLEVEPKEETVDYQNFLADVARLISRLRASGCSAVASCDFEDELSALLSS